jgi:hypothetical protein
MGGAIGAVVGGLTGGGGAVFTTGVAGVETGEAAREGAGAPLATSAARLAAGVSRSAIGLPASDAAATAKDEAAVAGPAGVTWGAIDSVPNRIAARRPARDRTRGLTWSPFLPLRPASCRDLSDGIWAPGQPRLGIGKES